MPCWGYDNPNRQRRWDEARRQVRAKFPSLIEGSSGWDRAVRNRFDRLKDR